MARVNLTDRAVSAAKAEPGTRLELHDALTPGLTLRVTDKGAKSWVLRYRNPLGRTVRHKLGDASRLGLRSARLEAGRLKDLIDKGGDPLAEKRQAREAARSITVRTFGDLLDAYWTACEAGTWKPKKKRKRASTLAYEKRLAERHISPAFKATSLDAIKRGTIESLLLERIVAGIGAQTNRTHAIIRQAFAFGIARDFTTGNPALAVPALHDAEPRRVIWKDDGLKSLWAACQGCDTLRNGDGERVYVSRSLAIAVQLAAILLQRRVEIAHMTTDELDLDAAIWTIPGERMKGGRPHLVPLPPRAVALIREAVALAKTKGDGRHVFPSPDGEGPISEDSVTKALAKLRGAIGVSEGTVHDLRRTGSTAMTGERLGISPFIRSQVLGHMTDAGGGAAVSSAHYDLNTYLPEKRRALAAWENLLLEIVGEKAPASNVRPLREAAQ